ncbi:HDOD domain-containing protein [Endothiovibrio diazotrophicus]
MIQLEEQTENLMKGYFIPPKPELLSDLHAAASRAEPDPGEVAEIVARDVGLSAAVLKTINSPLFGMRRTISDIRQAALLLGIAELLV